MFFLPLLTLTSFSPLLLPANTLRFRSFSLLAFLLFPGLLFTLSAIAAPVWIVFAPSSFSRATGTVTAAKMLVSPADFFEDPFRCLVPWVLVRVVPLC